MKKLLLVLFLVLVFVTPVFAGGKSVNVKGYYRKNGTYVAPYTRSAPSSSGTYKSAPTYKPKATYSPSSYSSSAPSDSVKVEGYYRKDGTYVRPHYRSKPDSDKSNNYGKPSYQQQKEYKDSSVLPTYKYDYDKDGTPNRLDKDSDNDGIWDNYDRAPYNPNEFWEITIKLLRG